MDAACRSERIFPLPEELLHGNRAEHQRRGLQNMVDENENLRPGQDEAILPTQVLKLLLHSVVNSKMYFH